MMTSAKISRKLPALFATVAILAAGAVGFGAYWQARDAIVETSTDGLAALTEARAERLREYLGSIEDNLKQVAARPLTTEALAAFTADWAAMGTNQLETLRAAYITDNPYPVGQKENFDRADDGSSYSQTHA